MTIMVHKWTLKWSSKKSLSIFGVHPRLFEEILNRQSAVARYANATARFTTQIWAMGMGRWPYGYYRMGLRLGKRRMGMPEEIVDVAAQGTPTQHQLDESSGMTATSGNDEGVAQQFHESTHVDQQRAQPSSVEEEAATCRTEGIKRQRTGASPLDSETPAHALSYTSLAALGEPLAQDGWRLPPPAASPALDLPALQRQSMFALAMLVASRRENIASRPPPPSTLDQQPLPAPTPWFLGDDAWQFLHDASRQQIRGQGGRLAGEVS